MDNAFLAPPRRWWSRVAVGLVGLAVGVAVTALLLGGGRNAAPASFAATRTPANAVPSTARSGAPSATAEPVPGVAGPLTLVHGTHSSGGISIGYPHSQVGAVSAAVEYGTQCGSTLDVQRSTQIGRVIADASYGDVGTAFAQGMANTRHHLGLPSNGPVPPGASMTFSTMAYQVRDAQADRVTVLLLAYLTTTTPADGMRQRYIVVPALMVWTGGDWKLARRPDTAPQYTESVSAGAPERSRPAGRTSLNDSQPHCRRPQGL
jgi:hypothetical protein